jgi:hypothetical protein
MNVRRRGLTGIGQQVNLARYERRSEACPEHQQALALAS